MRSSLLTSLIITSLLFLTASTTLSNIDTLTGSLVVISASGLSGTTTSLSYAGDINKDGYDDLIIANVLGDPPSRADAGIAYVIFGVPGGISNINVATLTSLQGFKIYGAASTDYLGYSVKDAGDFNGDGIHDIIVGAPLNDPFSRSNAGSAYVIFGKTSGLTDIDLPTLPSSRGISISGSNGWRCGTAVSSAGDINGDGVGDVIVGCPDALSQTGLIYVVYGSNIGVSNVDLASLTSAQGFSMTGTITGNSLGGAISYAGDFNNDGVDDILIGKLGGTGAAYVIFGKKSGLTNIMLGSLLPTQGIALTDTDTGERFGVSVSHAGDINGDGISDIIIGAETASPDLRSNAGAVYVIFGKTGISSNIEVSSLSNTQGFKINGAVAGGNLGHHVSYAGDINGDGISDVVIGAVSATVSGRTSAGAAYVIYGRVGGNSDIDTANIDTDNSIGFKIIGNGNNAQLGQIAAYGGNIGGASTRSVLIRAINPGNVSPAYLITKQVMYNYWDSTQLPSCPYPLRSRTQSGALYCDYPCNVIEYLFFNGSCGRSCDSGLQTTTSKGKNYCNYPCAKSQYLFPNGVCSSSCNAPFSSYMEGPYRYCTGPSYTYWDNTQSSQCNYPLQTRIQSGIAYCDYPCASTSSFLYWDKSCETTCDNGLILSIFKDRNFCNYPCQISEYLYTSGSCLSSCEPPFVSVIKHGYQFCYYNEDYSPRPSLVSLASITNSLNSNTQTVMSILHSTNPLASMTSVLTKMFMYTRYLNITNSPRLQTVYYNTKINPGCLDIAPKIPSHVNETYNLPSPNFKFTQYKFGASFLLNYWNSLISLTIIYGSLGIVCIVNILFQKYVKKPKINSVISKARNIAQNFAIQQLYITFGDITVYTVLEIQAQATGSFQFTFSFALAILLPVIVLVVLTLHALLIKRYQKLKTFVQENPKHKEQFDKFCENNLGFQVLFGEFRDDSFGYQAFLLFFTIRDILFGLTVATLYRYPLVQTSLIFFLGIPILYYTIKKRPHRDIMKYIQHISLELQLFAVNFALLELAILDMSNPKDALLYKRFGEMIVVCNIISHFIPIVCIVIKVIVILVQTRKKIWLGIRRALMVLNRYVNIFSFSAEEQVYQQPQTIDSGQQSTHNLDLQKKRKSQPFNTDNEKETALQKYLNMKKPNRLSVRISTRLARKRKSSQDELSDESKQIMPLDSPHQHFSVMLPERQSVDQIFDEKERQRERRMSSKVIKISNRDLEQIN